MVCKPNDAQATGCSFTQLTTCLLQGVFDQDKKSFKSHICALLKMTCIKQTPDEALQSSCMLQATAPQSGGISNDIWLTCSVYSNSL